MDTTVDLLQIKIDKAKAELSEESRRAIDTVDWKTVILAMRAEKGYSYAQLEDLELETELLLCGLLSPENYPKELESRMNIPKAQIDILINEMNEKVFKKIREELVKNIERKKISEEQKGQSLKNSPRTVLAGETPSVSKAGFDNSEKPIESREELLKIIENPPVRNATQSVTGGELLTQKELPAGNSELEEQSLEVPSKTASENKEKTPSILAQKLSGSFQIPMVQTEHTLNNISKDADSLAKPKTGIPNVDPYREIPQ